MLNFSWAEKQNKNKKPQTRAFQIKELLLKERKKA